MVREYEGETIQKVKSIRDGVVKIVTAEGEEKDIVSRVDEDTIFPEGAIEALFRRVPQVLSIYGDIASNNPGWFDEIVKMSKYDTPLEAIPHLRIARISAMKAAKKVYSLMLNAGTLVDRESEEIFISALERDFRSLYVESTEVKAGIKK